MSERFAIGFAVVMFALAVIGAVVVGHLIVETIQHVLPW